MANKDFGKYAETQTWDTNGGDFENPNDGSYVGIITGGEVKKSGSGYWMLLVKIKITEAEEGNEAFIGKTHYVNLNFEGKNGWNPWKVKAFFKEMSLELPEFSDIEDTIVELADANTAVSFDLRTKNDFLNTTITEVLEGYKDPLDEEEEEEEEEEENANESSDLPSEEDVDDMTKEDCVEFAKENGIELSSKMLKKIRTQLKEWIASQDTSEEDEDEDEDDDESKEELLTFCASAGIEGIDEDSSIEEMIAELKTYEFEASELSSDETEVLKKHGLSSIIKTPHKVKAKTKTKGSKK